MRSMSMDEVIAEFKEHDEDQVNQCLDEIIGLVLNKRQLQHLLVSVATAIQYREVGVQ